MDKEQEWKEAVLEMCRAGYAVIYWTPEELRGVAPKWVEEACDAAGQSVIDCMSEGDDDVDPTRLAKEPQ